MSEFSKEGVETAVAAILEALGSPTNGSQAEALKAFQQEDYARVKRLGTANLGDNYIKALGYLGSAFKLTPNTDTILSESARAAAAHVQDTILASLGSAIAAALDASPSAVG
jgi:hypothetical protein